MKKYFVTALVDDGNGRYVHESSGIFALALVPGVVERMVMELGNLSIIELGPSE